MNTVLHQQSNLDSFLSDASNTDYDRAVTYCTNILTNCPASVAHNVLKCEYLLRSHQLKEAVKFSADLMQNPELMTVPLIQCWRGRILCYSGAEN